MERQAGDEEATFQVPLLHNRDHEANMDASDEGRTTSAEDGEDENHHFTSYCKYYLRFARWILALLIVDLVVFILVSREQFYHSEYWHEANDKKAWKYESSLSLVALLCLVINAVFFRAAAKVINRDVEKVDEETTLIRPDREDQSWAVEIDGGSGEGNPLAPSQGNITMDWNNYDHIYGKVARKIDVWLLSMCQTHRITTGRRPNGTSFLVHVCWMVYAFLYAISVSRISDVLSEKQFSATQTRLYDTHVHPTEASNPTGSFTRDSANFENISQFPEDVQKWITNIKDTESYDFPTAGPYYEKEAPILKDRVFLRSKHDGGVLEVISVNNSLITRNYSEHFIPHFFIPVQNTMVKDDNYRASQYCSVSMIKDSYGPPIRSSPPTRYINTAHCIDTSITENNKEAILKNTTLEWSLSSDFRGLTAASYNDLVFVALSSIRQGCREVCQLDPTTMETSIVYRRREVEKFVARTKYRSGWIQVCVDISLLVVAGWELVVKEGLISGVVPLAFALAYALDAICKQSVLLLTFGTIILSVMKVHSDSGRNNYGLPVWIGSDFYTWGLYGWIFSFAVRRDLGYFYSFDISELAWLYFVLSGLVMGHPTLEAVGIMCVVNGGLTLFVEISFLNEGFDEDYVIEMTSGFGCIMVGNWISKKRGAIYARCSYLARCLAPMFLPPPPPRQRSRN